MKKPPSIKPYAIVFFVLLSSCGSEFYTQKELRNQIIPAGLRNKTWTLRQIHSKVLGPEFSALFNRSNGTDNCQFTFQFVEKGQLIMKFKEHNFSGKYLVDGDKFKHLFDGAKEQIVWTTNPECTITPTELGYVFNNGGSVKFRISNDSLMLQNTRGDRFVLTSRNL